MPITAACEHAGIAPSSHHRAMDNGLQAEQLAEQQGDHTLTDRQRVYREYRESVVRARARVAIVHVSLINKAAVGGQLVKETTRKYRNDDGEMVTESEREYTRPDWKASRFLVQHSSYRDEFADRSTRAVELTGADGGPLSLAPSEEIVASLADRLRVVAERQAKQLPGGWDAPEGEDPDVTDAVIVDEESTDDRGR